MIKFPLFAKASRSTSRNEREIDLFAWTKAERGKFGKIWPRREENRGRGGIIAHQRGKNEFFYTTHPHIYTHTKSETGKGRYAANTKKTPSLRKTRAGKKKTPIILATFGFETAAINLITRRENLITNMTEGWDNVPRMARSHYHIFYLNARRLRKTS